MRNSHPQYPQAWERMFSTVLFCCFLIIAEAAHQRPHVIFILADDLGWNDLAFHGETEFPTPNLDTLAADGILLNNYYVLPVCTPSRASLMTGLYAANTGLQNYVIDNAGPWALPLDIKIMPQYFKELGYKARMVGKWHLGFHEEKYTPLFRGFDSHYGFWGSNMDHFQHTTYSFGPSSEYSDTPADRTNQTLWLVGLDFRNNRFPDVSQSGRYSADIFTDETERILKLHNKHEPLLLLVTHHSVHRGGFLTPVIAPKKYVRGFEYIKSDARRNFAGAVTALDTSVGRIFKTLRETGMLNNSIVVFSSDNGADVVSFTANGGSNWPFRGQKFTNWEGGVRGTGIVWSPLLRRNRRVSDQMMHISDWLPTLYKAAGGNISTMSSLDGINMWEALSDDLPSPRNLTLINVDQLWNMGSVRLNDFKLVNGTAPLQPTDSWYGPTGRTGVAPKRFRSRSLIKEALRKFYKDPRLELQTPVININCGQRSNEPTATCDPLAAPCLFNIRQDPCEYNNIAQQNPQMARTLTKILQQYRDKARPVLTTTKTYKANPLYHNGMWTTYSESQSNCVGNIGY